MLIKSYKKYIQINLPNYQFMHIKVYKINICALLKNTKIKIILWQFWIFI